MTASSPEVVVNHVCDLSSSKKPILFLSFLFFQTDLFLEVGILDDPEQTGRNPRIQHLKIREMSTPLSAMLLSRPLNRPSPLLLIHYIAFESELEQALTWVLNLIFQHENVEGVKLRDLKFLLINYVYGLLANLGVGIVSILFFTFSCRSQSARLHRFPICSIKIPRMKHSSFRSRY